MGRRWGLLGKAWEASDEADNQVGRSVLRSLELTD